MISTLCLAAAILVAAPLEPEPTNNRRVIETKKRDFRLPISLKDGKDVKELVLLISVDKGKTWITAATAAPDADHFDYHATQDGLYWFVLQIVRTDGSVQPEFDRGKIDPRKVSLMVRIKSE
jgi:hypothetical protein